MATGNGDTGRIGDARAGRSAPASPLRRFALADWHIDADANRLRRGESEFKLDSRTIAVLVYLAEHAGELVPREQLERAVWGRTVVGYDALTTIIARLRKVLDDDPRQPRYIETIAKKGYRLIAPVAVESPQSGPRVAPDGSPAPRPAEIRAPWSMRALLPAGLVVLAVALAGLYWLNRPGDTTARPIADRPSIVVTRFANLGDKPDESYFSDGVTADINTALSKLSGLLVVSSSSATGAPGRPPEAKTVARTLGVRYVLEGSVRRAGDRLRVNVNLLDAGRDAYLWSEKYDRRLDDVFAVQDEIVAKIVSALSVQLTDAEKRRAARRYTARLDAYDDFLKGQAHYFRHTREDNRQAREYFQQAIDRDPAFARAYSAMALTFVAEQRYGWGATATGPLDRALALARHGVSLDAELPQAHWVLGYVYVFRKQYEQAVEAASRAVELDPNFADSYLTLAVSRIHFGKPDEALGLIRKAMLLNPDNPVAYSAILGQAHYFMGNYGAAVEVLREALERNATLPTAHVFLIASLSELNRKEEAVWAAEQFRVLAPQFRVDALAGMLPVQDEGTVNKMKDALRRAGL